MEDEEVLRWHVSSCLAVSIGLEELKSGGRRGRATDSASRSMAGSIAAELRV
jgi:hypothetical protein